MNQKMIRAIGVGIPAVTAVVLFGILGDINTVLFNTGLKVGHLVAVGNILVAWMIYKNYI